MAHLHDLAVKSFGPNEGDNLRDLSQSRDITPRSPSARESGDLLDKCTLLLREENEGGRNGVFEDATPNLYFFSGVRGFRIAKMFYQTLDRDASWPLRLYFVAELYKK